MMIGGCHHCIHRITWVNIVQGIFAAGIASWSRLHSSSSNACICCISAKSKGERLARTHFELEDARMLANGHTFSHWHHDLNAKKACRFDLYTDLDGLGQGATEQGKMRRMVTLRDQPLQSGQSRDQSPHLNETSLTQSNLSMTSLSLG